MNKGNRKFDDETTIRIKKDPISYGYGWWTEWIRVDDIDGDDDLDFMDTNKDRKLVWKNDGKGFFESRWGN